MLTFYTHFISPSSPHRAKLAVHLVAQSKPAEPPLADKKTQTLALLTPILKAENLTLDPAALQARLENASTAQELPAAIEAYLTQDLSLPKDKVDTVVDEARAALGLADSGVPDELKAVETQLEGTAIAKGDAKEPVLITDVRAFKAALFASTGVRPVRELEEFADGGAKL